ncbi:sodium:proton antiporter [Alloscardovia theropitheci]|uniref:Sodium:proton antiporter n=1 Tax=Alloscardovia theropitheci TaxID=2496842 RepID=A0A4V2MU25_9BIFI|nr:sodium:proton antiporter [Alloscardovia theropitheci]TCD54749.1 sodium:proton antiporter [Alloscardovia theropitheci]
MQSLLLILEIGIAVVISSLLSPYIPRVSMPLVQILLGVIWFFVPGLPVINIDSELFLLLFIAPLLYREAVQTSRSSLRNNLGVSLSLAVGLVLLSVLISGYTLQLFLAVIPLAAGFALGAALGPTDAVAVAQLGSEAQLTPRQHAVLSTESLFNDAASIVSFQFAIAALLTGQFSPVAFTGNVIYSFLGGALLGTIFGVLFNRLIFWMRRVRLETTTNRILIELMIPFFVYWVGEEIHVSGVIAVVVAGLIAAYHRVGVGEDLAEINRVSSAVWEVFTFVLNGSVFVLLGIELPLAMRQTLLSERINTWALVVTAIILCIVLLALRFIWIAAMLRLTKSQDSGKRRKMTKERWHSAAVMTFGGAKGTISLILAFSLPSQLDTMTGFPVRTASLFIAALYIIISLLLANIVVPILAPPEEDEDGHKFALANLEMLNRTLMAISRMHKANPEQHVAIEAVMRSYYSRIARQRGTVMTKDELNHLHAARMEMRQWQSLWLENYAKNHPEYRDVCERLLAPIEFALSYEGSGWKQRIHTRAYFLRLKLVGWLRSARATVRFTWKRTLSVTTRSENMEYRRSLITRIQLQMFQDAIHHEFTLINYDQVSPIVGSTLVSELRSLIQSLQTPSIANPNMPNPDAMLHEFNSVLSQAYAIELETIRTMLDNQEITRDQARSMRHNVFIMQSDSGL